MSDDLSFGMVKCANCGGTAAAGSSVCPYCGQGYPASQAIAARLATPDQAQNAGQTPGYPPVPGYPPAPADWQAPQAGATGQVPAYGQNGYQPYGYPMAPAARSSVPIAVALALIGLVVLIVTGGILVFVSAGRNSDPGVATVATSAPVSAMAIAAPSVTTPPSIPSSGRTLGNASAPVTLDMWVDYQCPPCDDFHVSVLPRLIDNYVAPGKVAIVSHNFPVIDMARGGHESVDAANAALCAADQGKFWTYQDWLFANQGQEAGGSYAIERLLAMGSRAGLDMNKFQPCVSGGVHSAGVVTEVDGAGAPVTYAPSLFVNGKLVSTNDYASVSAAIDAAIASK